MSDQEKYELVCGSYKLFKEVDINDDGHMAWEELMQYIIDAVLESSIGGDNKKESVSDMIR